MQRKVQLFFSGATVNTQRKNKPTYWAGGRCFQCSDGFGGEHSSLELGSSLKDQPRMLLVMG